MRSLLVKFWPVLVIIAVWFAFASPYFLKNKIPYPAEYQVSFFSPWVEYPQFAGPVKNNALSDVVDEIYPWKHFTIEELKKGQIPYWNPYSFSGTPHLANYQSAVFSPLNSLFFIFSFVDAWSLLILLQPLLAGLLMYLFMRQLQTSRTAAILGSVAFMFCGFMTVWMPYGTLALAAAFLPLILFAIEKIFVKKNAWFVLLLALSLAFSFFSGHFQTSLYALCFTTAYLLFKFFQTKNTSGFFWSVGGVVLGLLIALVQIFPSLELYKNSVRSELFSNGEGIPWYYIITVFAPDFFGNPVTRNDWIGHYAEWASFVGVVPLLFASAALFVKKNKKTILFFFLAAVVAFILALDTPLQQLLAALKIPVFSTSIPSRIIILFSFSLAVLSGYGLDLIKEKLQSKPIKEIILPFTPAILFFVIGWICVVSGGILPADKAVLAKHNLLLPTGLFMLTLLTVVLTKFIKSKHLVIIFPLVILMLACLDSFRFAGKWVPFEAKRFVYPNLSVITAMQTTIGDGRYYGNIGAYLDTYYHLPSIEGYDPLYSSRYGEFIESAKTGEFAPAVRSLVQLDQRGKYTQRVLDLLGVTLIYQPISHTNQPWAFPLWEHPSIFPTVYRDASIALFKNNSALPRVKVFSQYEVLPAKKDVIKRFFTADFDFRKVLLLEEDPGLNNSIGQRAKGSAKIEYYSPAKVVVAVSSSVPALLFLSDSYNPHWKARVNGKEEKIYIADYTLRAVHIPAGKSTVEFSYQ